MGCERIAKGLQREVGEGERVFGPNAALFVCESVNKVSVFAHKDSSVTVNGVFLFTALAIRWIFFSVRVFVRISPPVDFGPLPTSSVVGILYQTGLVHRILDFPLCKYESRSLKVTAINNL